MTDWQKIPGVYSAQLLETKATKIISERYNFKSYKKNNGSVGEVHLDKASDIIIGFSVEKDKLVYILKEDLENILFNEDALFSEDEDTCGLSEPINSIEELSNGEFIKEIYENSKIYVRPSTRLLNVKRVSKNNKTFK